MWLKKMVGVVLAALVASGCTSENYLVHKNEKIVEVEKDDIDVEIKVPKAIKDLEKRLAKKLNK